VSGCVIEGEYKYKGAETTTESVDLTGVDTIEMKLGSSDIGIISHGGSDGTFVIKKTFKTNKKDLGPELLEEAKITFKREGTTLTIERKPIKRKGMDMFTRGYVSIDITATLATDLTLIINTGSGDIEIDDRTAPVTIRTGSGDVIAGMLSGGLEASTGSGDVNLKGAGGRLEFTAGSGDLVAGDLKGDVRASVGSGDVEIDRVVGDVNFSSGSGDLEIGSSRGALKAGSGSGDLEIRDHAGNADLTTSSGDIALHTSASQGEIEVGASSGDVEVYVYNTDSVELDLRTSTGSMTSNIPLVVKDASRKRLFGKSGAGALRINVSTSSGDIEISKGSI
jgi:DUF4097 and DUF4098 domain-containing protein YvlB